MSWGGGDFADDRIIPDCVRAIIKNQKIVIRNPHSIRPYQHVLEPVISYLIIAMKQYKDRTCQGSYNIGPDEESAITTGELVSLFCEIYKNKTGKNLEWEVIKNNGPHEAGYLKLDCSKVKKVFGLSFRWDIKEAVEKVIDWTDSYLNGKDVTEVTEKQITEYLGAEKEVNNGQIIHCNARI